MSKSTELAKEFGQALGFKGRLFILLLGVVGLFFPGWVTYVALVGIAKGLKDADIRLFLEELRDD